MSEVELDYENKLVDELNKKFGITCLYLSTSDINDNFYNIINYIVSLNNEHYNLVLWNSINIDGKKGRFEMLFDSHTLSFNNLL